MNWSHRDLGKAASLTGWDVMAKNRGWELLGHLVDILIFSQIKFSFQKFGLKLGGKLWNTGIHFSACFVGLVATDWQISGLNLKIAPKS